MFYFIFTQYNVYKSYTFFMYNVHRNAVKLDQLNKYEARGKVSLAIVLFPTVDTFFNCYVN